MRLWWVWVSTCGVVYGMFAVPTQRRLLKMKSAKSVALLLTGAVLGASLASPAANAAA